MLKIAVIGGGPAGVFAAIIAKQLSYTELQIDIYDKHASLNTILPTGGGRCNFANSTFDVKELAKNYPRGEKFLYSVFTRFGTEETLEWFKDNGIAYYTQDDGRIFPRSDSSGVFKTDLMNIARTLKINFINGAEIQDIREKDGVFGVDVKNDFVEYDKVIISTGGTKSANSSIYNIIKNLGHDITKLAPSLSGLVFEKGTLILPGLSIKDAKVQMYFDNKLISTQEGDFVYTHDGISGPLAFKISAYSAFVDYDRENPLVLKFNFLPDMDFESLDKKLREEFDRNSKKDVQNIVSEFLPKSLAHSLLNEIGIAPDTKVSYISKDMRRKIVNALLSFEVKVESQTKNGEIVTAGGVNLKEVNPKTMESKIKKGLYFCGEVLDIDGLTGGFNLQACWSTGYIVGSNVFVE